MKEAGIRFDNNLHVEIKLDPDQGSCDVVVTITIEGSEFVQTGSVVWD